MSDDATLRIVELGCGDGRFAEYLEEHLGMDFEYRGVDCSYGLIDSAQKKEFKHKVNFVVADMVNFLSLLEQQSVDVVVSIASIQHLHHSSRSVLRDQLYRILDYDGLHISINRSYSKWMLTKHIASGALIAGIVLQLINHKTYGWSDYMIPFSQVEEVKKVEKGKGEQKLTSN